MSRRSDRVEEHIRTLMSELLRREAHDPRLSTGAIISITSVDVTPDLRYAKIYVSIMGSAEEVKGARSALRHGTAFFRRELGERLNLRLVPEVSFEFDDSVQRGARVMELLHQIEQEEQERKSDGDAAGNPEGGKASQTP